MEQISDHLTQTIKKVFNLDAPVELTRPDEAFGDFATNIALQLANKLNQQPRQIAEQIIEAARADLVGDVKQMSIAGPGFINITLTDAALFMHAAQAPHTKLTAYKNKVFVTEYSDLNPFKAVHAGHLYTTVVGDAISRLIERAGGTVHRVNFGGDVGLHAAKAMWAIIDGDEQKAWANVQKRAHNSLHDRSTWMASRYTAGNEAYETNESAKAQIVEVNKKIYQLHSTKDKTSVFAHIYWTCRKWSYQYFDSFYKELGVHPFKKYYPESQTAPIGIATVKEQLAKGVYQQSDGAVVFNGEPYGLHTRVFINSHGLPTYEAKDVGLIMAKWRDYAFDTSLIITGNDIVEYMKVVLKSIEQFQPELAKRSQHLTHGNVKLEGGVKMSSRKGNTLYANDVLQAALGAAMQVSHRTAPQTSLAAVKYSFLKQRMGGDIIFNPKESVVMDGNSGPYLQYAYARARGILLKADQQSADVMQLDPAERSLTRKISEYPEALAKSLADYMPHHICTYLYELAQVFNRFYEQSRVISDPRQPVRLQLVGQYAAVLKDGLELLGIAVPERL